MIASLLLSFGLGLSFADPVVNLPELYIQPFVSVCKVKVDTIGGFGVSIECAGGGNLSQGTKKIIWSEENNESESLKRYHYYFGVTEEMEINEFGVKGVLKASSNFSSIDNGGEVHSEFLEIHSVFEGGISPLSYSASTSMVYKDFLASEDSFLVTGSSILEKKVEVDASQVLTVLVHTAKYDKFPIGSTDDEGDEELRMIRNAFKNNPELKRFSNSAIKFRK